MNAMLKFLSVLFILFSSFLLLSFNKKGNATKATFPYEKTGLSEREAAAHLLSRFTYGARPGDVDEVLSMGIEKWFEQQLNANLADDDLNERLKGYDALTMSNAGIVNTFVKPARVLRMALKEGLIDKDSVSKADKAAYKDVIAAYMEQKRVKPERELFRQLANQKILRAVYTRNQLQEVLTDFWFNHFNVSATKNDCAEFILGYEKDVIRPNVLGKFSHLLLATAKSPAMLLYLDNFSSSGADSSIKMNAGIRLARKFQNQLKDKSGDSMMLQVAGKLKNRKKGQGLNENYAREVMELHTLGVDGGYTQNDVTQAARVLTGWTVYPLGEEGTQNAIRKFIENIGEERLADRGFVHEGDFLFAANRHDGGEKVVLGKSFKPEGYNEGVELLSMLAHHPSTARFICRKLAVRFVSDNPPATLVDRMAKTFNNKDGDIKQVLLTMVASPEFWSKEALREKTKSPFELAISSIRGLDAEVAMPYQLYNWIDKMGQKLYYYQAPTGFPDKAQYWINTGALLNRMNFGLALASQRIPGVKIDLLKLNEGHEPESAEAALVTYGKIIMPERNLQPSVNRLTPLLHDPQLQQKIENKANKQPLSQKTNDQAENNDQVNTKNSTEKKQQVASTFTAVAAVKGSANMLSQVVGIIIGSPEFQRR
ncbi:MAG: DUF1800 domain-containing protein [Bacteroidota bacterium]|nr:DUF1800 domain-containing protein [Bacteroidota bacterium]